MTRVREATREDADEILTLHVAAIRAFGPDAYDEEQVAAWAEKEDGTAGYPIDESGHYLAVAEADEVVGYGHLVPGNDEVRAVYVHPNAARRGVGSAVLSHLEGYARGAGLPRLELWSSHNAVAFYERMGYRPVTEEEEEVTKRYDGRDVALPVVVMEKRLE
ncbi:GCN5 family acetyltransferase [Haladaptatus sp. R4]|uniref:GNAT family N-acetyltransferase n=1 Tax=Haladaptatus sp. R4 TaxID=1679489 RepID=UPI0007B46969|nr:GNAT family N-acetyltransferase [Haladaptatus sp. R4]KZN24351.1 GCN5 family acetyltransferase [Haladaptatus sp. R4]